MFAKNSCLVQINIHMMKNPGLQTLDLTVYITLTELDSIETRLSYSVLDNELILQIQGRKTVSL